MKSRNEYMKYTPEIINETLKEINSVNRTRAEKVKFIGKKFNLSQRQSREVYVKYFDSNRITRKLAAVDKSFAVATNELKSLTKPKKLRRLFWDIEVSPDVVLSWRTGYKVSINYDNIIKERAIICICWKWEGENQVHALHWDENQDDKAMIEKFLEVANQADEMVGHNGSRFDLPWFKTRCLFYGLQTIPDYKMIDTLTWARRHFYFNSNRLDYIGQYLGFGGKIKTNFGLWKDIVLNKREKPLKEMIVYCKRDVKLLEKVWGKLATAVKHKTHAGVLSGKARWSNPYTGNTNVSVSKTRTTATGIIQYQMRDKDDGTYYTISSKVYEQYIEDKKSHS